MVAIRNAVTKLRVKKESAQLRNYTFISVSATHLFRPFWPIKHPKKKMEYNWGVSLLERPRGHRD